MKILFKKSARLSIALGMLLWTFQGFSQNTCASPFVIPSVPFSSGAQTTCGTVNDYAAGFSTCVSSNYGAGEDYVYSINITTAPVTYNISLGGAAIWKIASIHSACPPAGANCVGGVATSSGSTASGNVTFPANGTYYIIIDTWPTPDCGAFTLDITVPPPPPANDNCSGAIAFPAIPTNGDCATLTGNTANATQSQTACAGSGADDDVWFSFVATATTAIVDITAISGNADRVHQIFSGSCGSLVSVKCSDPESSTTTGLTIGNTYYVRVHTYGTGSSTSFNICVKVPPPPPANDNCAGAIAFPTVPTNGDCVTLVGNTASASQSQTACTGSGADDDIWFSFVAPGSTIILDLTAISGSSDRVHQIFSGTCGSLVSVKCSDPESSTTTGLTTGETYYVRVHTYSTGNNTSFNICLRTPRPVPVNDLCSNAIVLSCGQTLSGYTDSSTSDSAPTCNTFTNTSPGVWYTFTGNGGTATISLCGSTFDTKLSVYTGNCGGLTCVTADDDFCSLQSQVSFATTPCVTYYVLVHAYLTNVGNFTIAATCTSPPAPPANDVCSGATLVTCGSLVNGNTSFATSDAAMGSCGIGSGGIPGKGLWYKLAGNGAQVTLNLCGSSFNTKVHVYSGVCGSLSCVVSNDDAAGCSSNRSIAVFNAVVGVDYYILVSGVAECDLGAFSMDIACLCGPTLSAPWTVNNIGASNGNGIDNVCNGTIDISASNFGSPSSDVQTFANQEFCGNFTITAKLESVTNLGWGGLMVRENDAPGSKKVALRTQLNSLFVRDLRATTNGVQSQQQWSRPTHSWVRITRTGNTFVGSTSFNGTTWQTAFTATLVLPNCIDAGLFAQSINVNTPTLAAFSNLGGFNTQIPNITDQNTTNRSIDTEKEFSVYPNPASDEINVKWISGYTGKAANITVTNQLGQTVVTQKLSAVTNEIETINVSQLTNGMYILSVQSEDKQTIHRKFTIGSIRP
jgi:hypothetical protein